MDDLINIMKGWDFTNPQSAWDWFVKHHERLKYPSRLNPGIARHWRRKWQEQVRFRTLEHLYAEIICDEANHQARMIISAHGNAKFFNRIETMMLCAPVLDGWEFIGFYPPAPPAACNRHNYPRVTAPPDAFYFLPASLKPHNGRYNLQLYTAAPMHDETEWNGAATQMMFNLLGEKMGGIYIRQVEVSPMPPEKAPQLVPFTALPSYIHPDNRFGLQVNDQGRIR